MVKKKRNEQINFIHSMKTEEVFVADFDVERNGKRKCYLLEVLTFELLIGFFTTVISTK